MSTTDLPGLSLLVGRYRLVERLGAGGMSVVWRGFDEVLGRQVAVKVLPPSVSADPSFRRRLRAEAQAAARLSHPHITNVYDYGEALTGDGDPVPFVVMELVDGESLAGLLGRMQHLPWHIAVRICAQVSAALAAAHARGIVHRDVTPANVMLTPSGAKVVDFGISALIGENDIDPDGSLLGTPAYLAPERLEGGQVSPASDVYAVGLLIYRAIIGQLPWDVGTTTALLRAHQYTEPEPLPAVPGMPRAVNALVGRCLEKHPDDRPSSAELAVVLADITAAGPPAHPSSWTDYGQDTTILPPRAERAAPPRQVARAVAPPPAYIRPVSAPPTSVPSPAGPLPAGFPPAGVPAAASAGSVWSGVLADGGPAETPSPRPPRQSPGPEHSGPQAVRSAPAVPEPDRPAPDQPPPDWRASDGRASDGRASDGQAPDGQAGAAATPAFTMRPGAGANGMPRNSRFGASRDNAVRPVSGQPVAADPADHAAADHAAADHAAADRTPADRTTADHTARSAVDPVAAMIRPSTGQVRPSHHEHMRLVPTQRVGAPAHPMAAMGSGPVPGRPGGSATSGRRLSLVLGAVLAAGALGYGFTTFQDDPADAKQTTELLPADSRRCAVTYGIQSRTGTGFEASMTVTNRSKTALKDWELRFMLRGDQVMTGIGGAQLSQSGPDVKIWSTDALAPQSTLVLALKGSYRTSKDVPVEFDLSGIQCNAYVSPAPGATPKRVEKTADGRITLVAQPPGTPVPGLSSGPAGYVPIRGGGGAGTNDPVVRPTISPVTGQQPSTGTTTTGPDDGGATSPATTFSPDPEETRSAPPGPPSPVAGESPTPTVSPTPSPEETTSPTAIPPPNAPANPPGGGPPPNGPGGRN